MVSKSQGGGGPFAGGACVRGNKKKNREVEVGAGREASALSRSIALSRAACMVASEAGGGTKGLSNRGLRVQLAIPRARHRSFIFKATVN